MIRIAFDGNLAADPELRYTPAGKAVADLRVGATPRVKNRQTDQWEDDGITQWYRISLWDQAGEIAAETLRKGDRVRVEGNLVHREFEGKDGTARTSFEVKQATVTRHLPKPSRNGAQGASGQSQWGNTNPGAFQGAQGGSVQSVFEDTTPPF